MKSIGENGFKHASNAIESVGTKMAEGLEHSRALESVGINISRSLLFLTFGIFVTATIHEINQLHQLHAGHKYGKVLKQVDKNVDLTESIEDDDKMIFRYWCVSTTFVAGAIIISGVYYFRNLH